MINFLVWVPGLWWLYPIRIGREEVGEAEIAAHGVYSALQIWVAICLLSWAMTRF